MTIGFNQIPSAFRVPFTFVEFDNSGAVQGPTTKQYKGLIIGQKLPAGTAPANTPTLVTSTAQGKLLAGAGSMLAHMIEAWFKANSLNPVYILPLADNGAGVAATGTITFTGAATSAGAVNLYLGGRLVQAAVNVGDSPTTVATALVTAINAMSDLPVTAANVAGVVTLTAKNKGTAANQLDVRLNYYAPSETLAAGLTAVVTALSGGSGNPSLTAAISGMGERQWDVIPFPYIDSASLTAMGTELTDRWGPIRQNDGRLVAVSNDTVSNNVTLGGTVNNPHELIFGFKGSPTSPYEIAAAIAGVAAASLNIDPARPLQTLALPGVLPPAESDKFLLTEVNTLLFNGIATLYTDDGGVVRIQRAITNYQKNPLGASDVSYLDWTTLATLSYLRYDFRTMWQTKYPRHKLANDGARVGAGQPVMTPKQGKAEAISKFREWEDAALCEGFDQFKNSLIVERSTTDVNRLNFFMAPDLVNSLIVTGVKIGFLL